MYNVVLIGCGHMGGVHLDDIYMKENVCVYGVCDKDEERAKDFCKRYNAKSYKTDYMDYMRDENTDIIICATYPGSHLEILKNCVKYNKHLLCEKPITPDLESAKEFCDIVKSSSIKVQIGFILRFNETYKKVAQMIEEGVIGKPLILRMAQNHHVMDWQKYGALLVNSSPLVDCGVHYIDIARWFTGEEITHITGIGTTIDDEVPKTGFNYGLMTMELSGGSIGYYEAGWGGAVASENKKEFIGPLGRIRITEQSLRASDKEEGDLIELYDKRTHTYENINVKAVRRPTGAQLQHLIDMIEKDIPATPTIDEVFEGLKIALTADSQIKKHQNI